MRKGSITPLYKLNNQGRSGENFQTVRRSQAGVSCSQETSLWSQGDFSDLKDDKSIAWMSQEVSKWFVSGL